MQCLNAIISIRRKCNVIVPGLLSTDVMDFSDYIFDNYVSPDAVFLQLYIYNTLLDIQSEFYLKIKSIKQKKNHTKKLQKEQEDKLKCIKQKWTKKKKKKNEMVSTEEYLKVMRPRFFAAEL